MTATVARVSFTPTADPSVWYAQSRSNPSVQHRIEGVGGDSPRCYCPAMKRCQHLIQLDELIALAIREPEGEPMHATDTHALAVMPAVSRRPEEALALQLHDQSKLALLRETLTSDLTQPEFELFVEVCRNTGLNPFMRQIHAVKRGGKNPKMTIQVGIDGFRLMAERTGDYAGQDGPYWCGDDGEWKDVWLSKEPPRAAKIGVLKENFKTPLYGVATYDEYVQTTTDYNTRETGPNSMWKKMPAVMLAKCAEALALRKAFPAEMSGIYTEEEMGQAENPPAPYVEAPAEPKPKYAWTEDMKEALADAPIEFADIMAFFEATREHVGAKIDAWLYEAPPTTPGALVKVVADWIASGRPKKRPARLVVAPEPAPVETVEGEAVERPINWDDLGSGETFPGRGERAS